MRKLIKLPEVMFWGNGRLGRNLDLPGAQPSPPPSATLPRATVLSPAGVFSQPEQGLLHFQPKAWRTQIPRPGARPVGTAAGRSQCPPEGGCPSGM